MDWKLAQKNYVESEKKLFLTKSHPAQKKNSQQNLF
jgi:hypothetical protein